MGWLRVKITDLDRFVMPDVCPNCLGHPADTAVSISRSFGIPFLSAHTTEGCWLLCSRCARRITRFRLLRFLIGTGPAFLLILGAVIAAGVNAQGHSHHPAGRLLLAALATGVGGVLLAVSVQRFTSRPRGCVSNRPAVKPIAGGKKMLSGVAFATYAFQHPIYVEQMVALNPDGLVQVKAARLNRAIAHFEAVHGASPASCGANVDPPFTVSDDEASASGE